jgi:signal transduction histidine kinase
VSRSDAVRAIVVLTVAVPLGIAGEWAYSRTGAQLPALLRDLAVGWAFVAAGLVAWQRQRERRAGTLMVAEGLSWFFSNFQGSGIAALVLTGTWLGALNEAILMHLVLAFPSGQLRSPAERRLVTALYVLALAGGLAFVFMNGTPYDPYRCAGCTTGVPPPALDDGVALVASHAGDGLGALLGVAVLVLVLRRWARSSGPGRRELAPVWLSLGACVLLIVSHGVEASPFRPPAIAALAIWITDILELAVPLGFLAVVLRLRLVRAAVGELVLSLGPDLSPAALASALRGALGDPSLELGLWHDASGDYRDHAGRPLWPAEAGDARLATRVDRDGLPLAVILHDPALAGDPRLLDAVAAATRLSAEPQRMAARIAAIADAERRQLERDLHDGAQQRFVLLAMTLGSALQQLGQRPDEPALRATLVRAADELRTGLGELRELARGLHPSVLTERGLAAAVESLAARMPIAVDAAVADDRWPPAVEANAYFVASEALTNVVKHAHAASARVAIRAERGRLVVDVADDGIGGADPERGSGLHGLWDRVRAAGGTLSIDSVPGAGTRIRAELPCE